MRWDQMCGWGGTFWLCGLASQAVGLCSIPQCLKGSLSLSSFSLTCWKGPYCTVGPRVSSIPAFPFIAAPAQAVWSWTWVVSVLSASVK